MANVDFTLEDIKGLLTDTIVGERVHTQGLIDGSTRASEARVIQHMDARFEESNLATVELVGTVLDQIDGLSTRIDSLDVKVGSLDVKIDVLDVKFDRIEGELKTTNRMVRKHSLDIMELRAA